MRILLPLEPGLCLPPRSLPRPGVWLAVRGVVLMWHQHCPLSRGEGAPLPGERAELPELLPVGKGQGRSPGRPTMALQPAQPHPVPSSRDRAPAPHPVGVASTHY